MNSKNLSDQIQILLNQFNARNFDLVISKGNILIKKNPEHIILYNFVGSAYQQIGDYINANKNFKNGLKLDPKNLPMMNNLAMSYKNLLKYGLAEKLYLEVLDINDKYINAYINLGNLKRDLNLFDEAIKLYEKALSISDDIPVIYYSLALAHQGIGNFEKAISYANKTLELNSNFTRADHLISQSKKYDLTDKHFSLLQKKMDNLTSDNLEKVDLYFSIAKAHEDMGNIKDAADNLIRGNKLKKVLIKYDNTEELKFIKNIKENFKEINYNKVTAHKNENTIFILGMPRSGTSLVEQIISSHSEVFGGGELPILSNIIRNNFVDDNLLFKKTFYKNIRDPLVISGIKSEYLNFTKNFKFSEKYITDKAPLNFRWIGFIKLMFPNIKIIHCTRDPKNNCLSMFKNLFEGSLNFTYDQDDLVEYYHHYLDLMSFWKLKFEDSILEIKYENLINNNVDEIKKIIKFCNLDWENDCLSFHKNKAPIKTMSTAQARRPIYKSSLKAYDKFKSYLTVFEKKL